MTQNVMKGNFKTLLRHFCLEGTVLGLKYFYLYPDRISRCFWAATLILIVAFAFNLTWLLYGRFAEMPTRITIENQYEPLVTLPYPAIFICSPNQMTLKSMQHFNKTLIDGNTTVDLHRALPQLLGFYARLTRVNNEDMSRLQSLITRNRYTVPEVMGLMPQSCEDFLKLCIFMQRPHPCHKLFHPVLTKQGLCCAFNSMYYFNGRRNERNVTFKPHMTSMRGISDALVVVGDYEPDDALPRTLFHVGAVRVMFNDWTEFPADVMTNLVYPNSEAFLAMRGTYTYCSVEVASLPSSSRECLFDHERHLEKFYKYRNSDCDHWCHMKVIERHCHCHPVYIPYVGTERACDVTKISCINHMKDFPIQDDSMNCECPRDCVSRVYNVDLNIGNLKALEHMTPNPFSEINFNHSTSILRFFFPSSVYVKKKQETVMSLISLASNLGGIFGLCMGVSVVSLMEIAFYTRKAVGNWVRKRVRHALEKRIQYYRPGQDRP